MAINVGVLTIGAVAGGRAVAIAAVGALVGGSGVGVARGSVGVGAALAAFVAIFVSGGDTAAGDTVGTLPADGLQAVRITVRQATELHAVRRLPSA
jgi:hypothetical protein